AGRFRPGLQDRDHVGRDLDAIDVDAGGEEVEEGASGPAADIENRLAELVDQLEVERSVGPTGRVAAKRVPRPSLEASVFEIHHDERLRNWPTAGRRALIGCAQTPEGAV